METFNEYDTIGRVKMPNPDDERMPLPKALQEKQNEAKTPNPTEYLLQFFTYAHLPSFLQEISKPFGDLAEHITESLPRNPERTVALRKLLEAKDCAVRAKLMK